jgi:Leucine-rich repeat (LRR) protein
MKETTIVQQWLDENYPIDKRKETTKLNISGKSLKGVLDLTDFINLSSLNCHDNELTGIRTKENLKNFRQLRCYNNLIEYLDNTELFPGLTFLECSYNELKTLNLSPLKDLTYLDCRDNELTDIDLSSLDSEKLELLSLSNNNLSLRDLSFLSSFTKIKTLQIGNDAPGKISNGIYNRFFGSLEPLKDMNNLRTLCISETDTNEGLEHLSETLLNI